MQLRFTDAAAASMPANTVPAVVAAAVTVAEPTFGSRRTSGAAAAEAAEAQRVAGVAARGGAGGAAADAVGRGCGWSVPSALRCVTLVGLWSG